MRLDQNLTTGRKERPLRALGDPPERLYRAKAGDGTRTHDPQLGKSMQRRMDKRVSLNHAENTPLHLAPTRSWRRVTGERLASKWARGAAIPRPLERRA